MKLTGHAPSYTNSPQKLRNSSQKNIEKKSIQQYFSPTLKNSKKKQTQQEFSSMNVLPGSRQGSIYSRSQVSQQEVAQNRQQINYQCNYQNVVNPNNFQFSTPQKLMNTIDSLFENSSHQVKSTQPSSILKSSHKPEQAAGFNQNIQQHSYQPNQNYQNYIQILSASQTKSSNKKQREEPVKAKSLLMSDKQKREDIGNLAQQYINRQSPQSIYYNNNIQQQNNFNNNSQKEQNHQEFKSIYQNQIVGGKVVEPESQINYMKSNFNNSNIHNNVEEVQQTSNFIAPFQDSASNIQVVQASLPTQNENLLTFQDQSSQQNTHSNLIYVESQQSSRNGEECNTLAQKLQNNQSDQIVENYPTEQTQNLHDHDEEAKKRYFYYINKRNEILKENYTYLTHQNHFSNISQLHQELEKGIELRCKIHSDFMSLYDENDQTFCCPSCVYENGQKYQKKTILPLKMCQQFVSKDINKYKEGLRSKVQYFENNILRSQLNTKLLQENFVTLNKRINQMFQQIRQQLDLKELEIKKEVKRQYDQELFHYQKIISEISPLQEALKLDLQSFKQNEKLDEFNNSLYVHIVLKQWQDYLQSYKRDVPVYSVEDMDIIDFPKISSIYKLIDKMAVIKNIQESSCKEIMKKIEESSQIKNLSHITIPENITIKQTATHYLKTTTRSKGRNDFQISEAIETIHQQSQTNLNPQAEVSPFRETIFRNSSKEKSIKINTSSHNINNSCYSVSQKDSQFIQPKQTEPTPQQKTFSPSQISKESDKYNLKQSLHKSPSFQVPNSADKNQLKQNGSLSKSNSNRSLNPSLDNRQKTQTKQQLSDSQARALFKQIIHQE
ncbi:hypothetical protein ABPG73_012903 [Tetrahymena malaccensis]